jgi:hypothetical protein
MKKLLLLLLFAIPSFAADLSEFTAGKTVAGRGNFYILQEDGSLNQLGLAEEIQVSDTIVTDEKSFVVIQLTDGTKVTIRPNSRLTIEEYYFYGDDSKATLSITEGGLRVLTGAITKHNPDNFTVKTPVALMGVRGTEFSLVICGTGAYKVICELEEK